MGSGMKLTEEEIDRILYLIGLEDEDGRFKLSLNEVARHVGVSRHTVYRVMRPAAAKWGRHTAWQSNHSTD